MEKHDKVHPLFKPDMTPGGGLSLFYPDWMHTKSLGTDAHLVGSCLAFMAQKVLPGGVDASMAVMWDSIQEFYKAHKTPCRLTNLTYKMVKHEPFPRLAAKAMETRHLVPALQEILEPWVGIAEVAYFQRLLTLSRRLDDLVFENKTFKLSEDERQDLCQGIFEYNQLQTKLARHFHLEGLPFCNFTVKNHYMCHIGLIAANTGVSPRVAFCYQGEDFMSLMKTLCAGSHRGVAPAALVNKVIDKYLRGLDLVLRKRF